MSILLIVLLVATFAVLITGIVVMVRGGETDKKLSNKLMAMRIWFQAITVAVVLLILYLSK